MNVIPEDVLEELEELKEENSYYLTEGHLDYLIELVKKDIKCNIRLKWWGQ